MSVEGKNCCPGAVDDLTEDLEGMSLEDLRAESLATRVLRLGTSSSFRYTTEELLDSVRESTDDILARGVVIEED